MAAALLIACAGVFLPTGLMFTGREYWGWTTTGAYVAWERSLVIAAVLSSLLGLTLVDRLLGTALARLAAVTYGAGAVLCCWRSWATSPSVHSRIRSSLPQSYYCSSARRASAPP